MPKTGIHGGTRCPYSLAFTVKKRDAPDDEHFMLGQKNVNLTQTLKVNLVKKKSLTTLSIEAQVMT